MTDIRVRRCMETADIRCIALIRSIHQIN